MRRYVQGRAFVRVPPTPGGRGRGGVGGEEGGLVGVDRIRDVYRVSVQGK